MTNSLQTLANNPQTRTNIWPTTRKRQMVWLAVLTAITLVGQYVLLGNSWLGHDAAILPQEFFMVEKALWGFRALVEVVVVIYVGMTHTDKDDERKKLLSYERMLIAIIVLTVGPVGASFTLKTTLLDILSWWGVVVWNLLMAGISATMLMAVSYAYKVQPTDEGYLLLPLVNYEKMLVVVDEAKREALQGRQAVDEALARRDLALAESRGLREAVEVLRLLPPSAQVQIVALFNQDVTAETLAESFSLAPATVRGVLAKVNSNRLIS